ncbi:hypothetical protein X777_06978 [Ooceraea biroi]|uniref:Uncharacterized protein n=1 Tax=Ooceraea biroi TaxID=2015173 RepID=A0A026WEP2_OOCBI|nr:hypothetical protein X777_06978 [Ooceraea biroi]
MLDLKSSGTTAAELPRTTAFTNLSMLFADAGSSYKGGWSHATSPAPGQGCERGCRCGLASRRASPGGCVETPALAVVTPKSRPHPGTIISRRSQSPARGHLCDKRLLAAPTRKSDFKTTRRTIKALSLSPTSSATAVVALPFSPVCRWDLDRGVGVCVREATSARSPAATLIAADPTTHGDPGTLVQGCSTRFPIRGEIRLFNTADTNCYLKVASAPWGSLHSDDHQKRKCRHPRGAHSHRSYIDTEIIDIVYRYISAKI